MAESLWKQLAKALCATLIFRQGWAHVDGLVLEQSRTICVQSLFWMHARDLVPQAGVTICLQVDKLLHCLFPASGLCVFIGTARNVHRFSVQTPCFAWNLRVSRGSNNRFFQLLCIGKIARGRYLGKFAKRKMKKNKIININGILFWWCDCHKNLHAQPRSFCSLRQADVTLRSSIKSFRVIPICAQFYDDLISRPVAILSKRDSRTHLESAKFWYDFKVRNPLKWGPGTRSLDPLRFRWTIEHWTTDHAAIGQST